MSSELPDRVIGLHKQNSAWALPNSSRAIWLAKYCFYLERGKNLPFAFALEERSSFSDLPSPLDILNKQNAKAAQIYSCLTSARSVHSLLICLHLTMNFALVFLSPKKSLCTHHQVWKAAPRFVALSNIFKVSLQEVKLNCGIRLITLMLIQFHLNHLQE